MNSKIAGYTKTEHFMLRQWERKVCDEILFKVLNKLDSSKGDFVLVVSRKIIQSICKTKTKELFILINGKTLITCFFGELSSLMLCRKKRNYKLLQK
jgi:hypothetical protein